MRPPAPRTRCQGRFSSSGATRNANPACRARPGKPAARATAPYVDTCPRGMEETTFQINSSAGFSSPDGRRAEREREPSELKGRNNAAKDFFERAICK